MVGHGKDAQLNKKRGIWYMHLKYVFCYLKIWMEIRMGEKICKNTCNIV